MPAFEFTLPAKALAGVKPFGAGGPPADGYYEVTIARMETTDHPHSGKLILTIDGHDGEVWAWWNLKVDNPSNDDKIGKNNKNAEKGQRTILESIGYQKAQIDDGPISHLWVVGKKAAIAYVAPVQNVTGSNPQVDFLSREEFAAKKASGTVPQRRAGATPTAAPPQLGNAGYSGGAPPSPPAPPTTPGAATGGPPAPPAPPSVNTAS